MMPLALVVLLALDGGTPAPPPPRPSPADQEVIDNLELLENLDGADNYELLEELSFER